MPLSVKDPPPLARAPNLAVFRVPENIHGRVPRQWPRRDQSGAGTAQGRRRRSTGNVRGRFDDLAIAPLLTAAVDDRARTEGEAGRAAATLFELLDGRSSETRIAALTN
ncbi:MAG: hypothetical protein EXQ52_09325 [Bryobacterales bacterium]|nr:hypothetical protein [Bryobacterales bacterium]